MNINFRKANKVMINNGFVAIGATGSHYKYKKNGYGIVVVNKNINPMVWGRIVKENDLAMS